MADVEQRAEAEAAHKGLSGGAAKAYVGGVFNRIRQAHARATTPGKGAAHLNRKKRVEAKATKETVPAKKKKSKHEQVMQAHREAYERLAAKFVTDIHGQNRRETFRDANELRHKVWDAQTAAQKKEHAAYDRLDAAETAQQRAAAQRAIKKAQAEVEEAKAFWDTVWDLSAAARSNPETTERWLAAHKGKR